MITRDEILDAVVKRACGYEAKDTVEEYAVVDGSLELVKRKVTTKDVPPDIAAAKLIIDGGDVSDLTDEQLEKERKRLIGQLYELGIKDGE
ncbi:MAG: hypothetical protein K2O04_03765 [Clostridiales bacterium]|nr:hypothetical protein [Clostridiales bacterium]